MRLNLIQPVKAQGFLKFARVMDWAMFWASFPLCAWLFYRSWPHPDVWAWISLAMIPAGYLLAAKDWQGGLQDAMRRRFFRG